MPFFHLKKRFEFLTISKHGKFIPKRSFVLQFLVRKHPEKSQEASAELRFGFTASKKVGNAVRRNRCKRRLRALVIENLALLEQRLQKPTDIVLIARRGTFDLPFSVLEEDFKNVLAQMEKSTA